MNTFEETALFARWLSGLRDTKAKVGIARRLDNARHGNFGDCEPVDKGVSEMRIHVGPGYRVYFCRIGGTVYLLLAGGNKSTQRRDITRALEMARTLTE